MKHGVHTYMVYYARRQQNIQQSRQKHTIEHKEEHNTQMSNRMSNTHKWNIILDRNTMLLCRILRYHTYVIDRTHTAVAAQSAYETRATAKSIASVSHCSRPVGTVLDLTIGSRSNCNRHQAQNNDDSFVTTTRPLCCWSGPSVSTLI